MSDEIHSTAYHKEIEMAFHNLVAAQQEVTQEQLSAQQLSQPTVVNFERAVLTMQRLLRPYITSPELQKFWQKMNIGEIPQVCGRRVVTEGGVGDFGLQKDDTVQIEHAPVEVLEVWADAMIQIYSDLGFAPEAQEAVNQTKIDGDLLEEVNQWREENL